MAVPSFIADSREDARFRVEVRSWLEENLPRELCGWVGRLPPGKMIPWHRKMYERGWIAPGWPEEYGGMGATLAQQLILQEEMGRIGAPTLSRQGLGHIGPILMRFGSDAQKAEHLPKILSGDVAWAQGYSEPGSGSDLASLTTRAALDGGDFVINGRKIWTTMAQYAGWMYALVRTDPDAPRKQLGISIILIDLKTPGITIRPIKTIAGDEEFAECTFENVRVPVANLVGAVNEGWRIARSLLDHERIGNASPQLALDLLDRVRRVARATGAIDDPAFQDRLTGVEIDVLSQAAIFAHAVKMAAADMPIGANSSFMKIVATENVQKIADLLMDAAGPHAADIEPLETEEGPIAISKLWLDIRKHTIYAGSNEIQRNIIAKRVLGLP
jgi:alkylation response protein AidB-like acyl-CoA dehydrogenase